jgi:hypothetical protein
MQRHHQPHMRAPFIWTPAFAGVAAEHWAGASSFVIPARVRLPAGPRINPSRNPESFATRTHYPLIPAKAGIQPTVQHDWTTR